MKIVAEEESNAISDEIKILIKLDSTFVIKYYDCFKRLMLNFIITELANVRFS